MIFILFYFIHIRKKYRPWTQPSFRENLFPFINEAIFKTVAWWGVGQPAQQSLPPLVVCLLFSYPLRIFLLQKGKKRYKSGMEEVMKHGRKKFSAGTCSYWPSERERESVREREERKKSAIYKKHVGQEATVISTRQKISKYKRGKSSSKTDMTTLHT